MGVMNTGSACVGAVCKHMVSMYPYIRALPTSLSHAGLRAVMCGRKIIEHCGQFLQPYQIVCRIGPPPQ